MPVKANLEYAGPPRRVVRSLIQPGRLKLFTNFDTSPSSIVAVLCHPDDSGAAVYDIPNNYPDDTREQITPDNLKAEIPTGGEFSCHIVTAASQAGRLVLKHVTPT